MTRPRSIEWFGLASLILGAVCIGFAPLWVRWSEAGPVATACHRLLLALPVLGLWAARERPARVHAWSRADRWWVVAAGALFALDLGAWHLSIRLTTVANATLLANLAPVFVTLGAWIFLDERPSTRFLGAMALGLAGAWLLTGANFAAGTPHATGDLLGLVTAVFYGGYQLCVARLRRRHPSGSILFLGSLTCIPLLALFARALGETLLPATARGWWVLVGLALTAQILGQGFITHGFAHLPAGYSSLTLLVQPLVAAAAAWALLGETMQARQIAGGCVLVLGIALARQGPAQSPSTPGNSSGAPPPRR